MTHRFVSLVTTIGLAAGMTLAVAGTAGARCDDPALAEAVRAQIATRCSCTDATNHGQYVSCVRAEVRQAVADGLPTNCKGAVTRCAARSTCGKAGFVTCCRLMPGWCREGLCQDGLTPCTLAEECPLRPKCSTKRSVETCLALGGTAGTGSCCDATCAPPAP
jgi:hypothetical protein